MSDFKDVMIKDVEFIYPRVDQLYKYDPHAKKDDGTSGKSVPATADEQGAAWSTSFIMSKEEGTKFWDICAAHHKERAPKEKFKTVHGYRQLEDDRLQFSCKSKGKTAKGVIKSAPLVIDGQRKPLENLSFYGGSKGNLKVTIMPSLNPSTKEHGVSLILSAIQVTDAVYSGGDDMAGFDSIAPAPKLDEDDPFGLPPSPQAAKQAPASNDLDDDIPF